MVPDRSKGQKLAKNAKVEKWDILAHFQTMWYYSKIASVTIFLLFFAQALREELRTLKELHQKHVNLKDKQIEQLLDGFQKQMQLIDVLRRQKVSFILCPLPKLFFRKKKFSFLYLFKTRWVKSSGFTLQYQNQNKRLSFRNFYFDFPVTFGGGTRSSIHRGWIS